MKVSAFELMPHRDLPDDFEHTNQSVWVTPSWHELADPQQISDYYNWTLDELLFAAEMGFDGVCTNEHHQSAYGLMPNPNIMASVLARGTQGSNVALVQMGSTLPAVNPPIRVAEEYGMLDSISGGRLVAGVPQGSAMDMNFAYGIPPIEQRERYREALELTLQAWQAKEPFAWNGKYFKLRFVNPWPRPTQSPHPPIWLPSATGSRSTAQLAIDKDFCYAFLGHNGLALAERVIGAYWQQVAEHDLALNPYRLAFLQVVLVSETDERAAQDYAKHVEYWFHKSWHFPSKWMVPPGYLDYPSLRGYLANPTRDHTKYRDMSFRDFVDGDYVVTGSPTTVRDILYERCKQLRVGNLMIVTQLGSMPHDLTLKNIQLIGEEVLPYIQPLWEEGDYVNHWWPSSLRQRASIKPALVQSEH